MGILICSHIFLKKRTVKHRKTRTPLSPFSPLPRSSSHPPLPVTGTLTTGKPVVTDEEVLERGRQKGLRGVDVLALAAAAEAGSDHPIAHAIVRYQSPYAFLFSKI